MTDMNGTGKDGTGMAGTDLIVPGHGRGQVRTGQTGTRFGGVDATRQTGPGQTRPK